MNEVDTLLADAEVDDDDEWNFLQL